MNKTANLQPIAKIKKQQEHNAGRLYNEAVQEAERQQKQLNELLTYRDEYIKKFELVGRVGMSAIQVQEYRLFISRLDEAIVQQQQFVINENNKCEASQKEWLNKRSQSKVMNKVVEKRQSAKNLQQQKTEQKQMEDRPQQNLQS